ncbi:hypothetical protein MC885_017761 [Smutsia gigantea]|nr:hypothetical protein MC885_017761 [Smutsia gigantea]
MLHVERQRELVATGPQWHKLQTPSYCHGTEAEEAPSEQSISVEGESQVRASKTGLSAQKMNLCETCVLVLKDILPQGEHQTTHPLQKPVLDGTRVRCFCFIANLHQQRSHGSGENPWKRAVNSASFVMSCSFYVSGEPFTCRELGENFLAHSDLLQYQATPRSEEPHSDNESGQAFHRGKSHYKWGECEKAASHNNTLVRHQSVCYGEGSYSLRKSTGEEAPESESSGKVAARQVNCRAQPPLR